MKTLSYRWRNSGDKVGQIRNGVDANVAAREFERLRRDGDRLKARDVVDAARPDDSPLHGLFEWDDSVAAEHYRLSQARDHIASIRVVLLENDHSAPKVTRAYVQFASDADADDREGYVTIQRVASDPNVYSAVLRRAAAELNVWRDRYKEFASLARIGDTARQLVLEEIDKQAQTTTAA